MQISAARPNDAVLRAFLLGNLSMAEAERVVAWMSDDPDAAAVLARTDARDEILEVLCDPLALMSDTRGDSPTVDHVHPVGGAGPVPSAVGPYPIVREISRGGMGVVEWELSSWRAIPS